MHCAILQGPENDIPPSPLIERGQGEKATAGNTAAAKKAGSIRRAARKTAVKAPKTPADRAGRGGKRRHARAAKLSRFATENAARIQQSDAQNSVPDLRTAQEAPAQPVQTAAPLADDSKGWANTVSILDTQLGQPVQDA